MFKICNSTWSCVAPCRSKVTFSIRNRCFRFALGAVLSQFPSSDTTDVDLIVPVAFYSRKFKDAEINYTVHDKELLAIVDSFGHWRHYLAGAMFPIKVLSDHRNLEYFRDKPILKPRHSRWADKLSEFDFQLIYRPGSANTVADSLSRSLPPLEGEGDSVVHKNPLISKHWQQLTVINVAPKKEIKNKSARVSKYYELNPIPVPETPWSIVALDFIV